MALKKQQEAEERKRKEWRVAVLMRGNIVTGAELDGWDQEHQDLYYYFFQIATASSAV